MGIFAPDVGHVRSSDMRRSESTGRKDDESIAHVLSVGGQRVRTMLAQAALRKFIQPATVKGD